MRVTRKLRSASVDSTKARETRARLASEVTHPGQQRKGSKWKASDDGILLIMAKNGAKWSEIRTSLSRFSIRELKDRLNHLEQHVRSRPGSRWSPEEDYILLSMRTAHADWSDVHAILLHRTEKSIEQRYRDLTTGATKRKALEDHVDELPRKKIKDSAASKTQQVAARNFDVAHDFTTSGRLRNSQVRNEIGSMIREKFMPKRVTIFAKHARTPRGQAALVPAQQNAKGIHEPQDTSEDWAVPDNDEDQPTSIHGDGSFGSSSPYQSEQVSDAFEDDRKTDCEIVIPKEAADLFGQTEPLIKILKAAKEHMSQTFKGDFISRSKRELPEVQAVRFNKQKIIDLYNSLATSTEPGRVRIDIESALEELENQVSHFELRSPENFGTMVQLARQVNILMFIDLLCVLSTALNLYAKTKFHEYEDQIWQLHCCIRICRIIVNLYTKSRSNEWKSIKISGIKNIRNSMLAPLVKVLKSFQNEMKRLQSLRMQLDMAASQKQNATEDEDERCLGSEYDAKYRRLTRLFLLRAKVARVRNIAHSKYSIHLKSYTEWREDREPYNQAPELDANGEPMERLPIFVERPAGRRPPRLATSHDEGRTWTGAETIALLKGLRKYYGPRVFDNIFLHFCQPGKVLSDRTVPQILRQTAAVREGYLEQAERECQDMSQCPTWLMDIHDLDLLDLL
ncbi:hypothetical protein, variant 3 [Verruconis gallopava]|nr:hypothetical protein, variant 1 [Verruconis gallopava]XP_016214333.1 hypothetical protein, variant 2 [Verruconis gallopava]XP_016214334.1 hypothetical protein, variant 3 [Verruconis gallopava]KIW04463.1 hypothetical protein, variant 1 [Verruconis gallopava]KIW04464.1 hypothetical protein, variant 2 [Verruconis gallopava]KIW04465.1 hypothetical protein, variant 3 [Verruconis gallopava]